MPRAVIAGVLLKGKDVIINSTADTADTSGLRCSVSSQLRSDCLREEYPEFFLSQHKGSFQSFLHHSVQTSGSCIYTFDDMLASVRFLT